MKAPLRMPVGAENPILPLTSPSHSPNPLSANGVVAPAAREAKDSKNKIDTKLEGGDFMELLATSLRAEDGGWQLQPLDRT